MYKRTDFIEERQDALKDFIREHSFATLVSIHEGEPFATRLPTLLVERADGALVIECHIALNNPQWKSLENQTALIIFDGPHSYISPNWYDTKGETVPTWNYVTVHAYGTIKLHRESAWFGNFLRRLTEKHEAPSPEPWTMAKADPDYIKSEFNHIVGIEFTVTRLEGKFKLNQNRTAKDRDGVIEYLSKFGDHDGKLIAQFMQQRQQAEASK